MRRTRRRLTASTITAPRKARAYFRVDELAVVLLLQTIRATIRNTASATSATSATSTTCTFTRKIQFAAAR